MKNLMMCFLSYFLSFTLNAMIPTGENLSQSSLFSIIESLRMDEFKTKGHEILNQLTLIALHNPGNMLARGLLYELKNNASFYDAQHDYKTRTVCSGKCAAMAVEFEKAPDEIRKIVKICFIMPLEVGLNLWREHISLTKNKFILQFSPREKNKINSILHPMLSEIFEHGSIYGIFILNKYLFSQKYFTDNDIKFSGKNKLLNIVNDNRNKVFNYFNSDAVLSNGQYELDCLSDDEESIVESIIREIALILGNHEALKRMLLTGTEMLVNSQDVSIQLIEYIQENFSQMLLYAAKITNDPLLVLIAAKEMLTLAEKAAATKQVYYQTEAISLFEHFLTMEQVNFDKSYTIKNKTYTPQILTDFYIKNKNYKNAKYVFIESWKKGFVPSYNQQDEIFNNINANDLLIDIEKADFVKKCSMYYTFLFKIYRSLENYPLAVKAIFSALAIIKDIKDPTPSELLYAQGNFTEILITLLTIGDLNDILSFEEIRSLFLMIKDLDFFVLNTFNGDFYYLLYIMKSNLKEDGDLYLSKAAEEEHPLAVNIIKMNRMMELINSMMVYPLKLLEVLEQLHIYQKEKDVLPEKVSKPTPVNSESDKSELPSSNDRSSCKQVCANIKKFIEIWENTHWKTSDRAELVKDFSKLVLRNQEIISGHSLILHENHGRRYHKYGNRASKFEIDTLVERARKFLAQLEQTQNM